MLERCSASDPGLRERMLKRDVLSTIWITSRDPIITELIAKSGVDVGVLDQEHGYGDLGTLLHQLQVMSAYPIASLARISSTNDSRKDEIKRVLELDPDGILCPMVETAKQAEEIVNAMRYPQPGGNGVRGVAPFGRGAGFGRDWLSYRDSANSTYATVVQVENPEGLGNVEEIASVDGVHAVFFGPMDFQLTSRFPDHDPRIKLAFERVADACAKQDKTAGIFVGGAEQVEEARNMGANLIAVSFDLALLNKSITEVMETFSALGDAGALSSAEKS